MSSWPSKPLEELGVAVIDGDRGANYPKSTDFMDEGHCLFLSATNVTKSGFKFDECQFISEEKHKQLRKGHLERGDIVVTTRGSVGHIAYYDESVPFDVMRLNSGMVILRNSGEFLETDYLCALMRSPWTKRQFDRMVFGSAQPQLTIGILNQLDIPSPKKAEQKKIAEILSTWDRAIENLLQQLERHRAFAKASYRRFLDDEHCMSRNLNELAVFIKDGTHGTHQNVEDGVPLLSAKDITEDGQITFSEPRLISQSDYDKLHRTYEITKNDLLLTIVGTIGRVAIVPDKLPKFAVQRSVGIIRPRNPLEARFIYHHLRSPRTKRELLGLANASAQAGVYLGELAKLKLRLPDENTMIKMVNFFDSCERTAWLLQTTRNHLTIQKKGLMQKLLTGKVRVKV